MQKRVFLSTAVICSALLWACWRGSFNGAPANTINREELAEQLSVNFKNNNYPEKFQFQIDGENQSAIVKYSLDREIQIYADNLLKSYKPDHAAIVVLDAQTGRVLAMASRSHQLNENLVLRATFPAASIFKVVTAAAALDLNKVTPETTIAFNGSNYRLYKRAVASTKENRWTRHVEIKEAFARSLNVVFAKLGLFYVGPEHLQEYAAKFKFNSKVPSDMPLPESQSRLQKNDPWNIATAAAGFTQDNTLSPLHGAVIAATVANDGVMMSPYVVDSIQNDKGDFLYSAAPQNLGLIIPSQTTEHLRELFKETVKRGTSRKAFRPVARSKRYTQIEFGGKTGSLTGSNPQGKCDWFIGYGRTQNQKIAIAALTVNEEKWRVKSATLAQTILSKIFQRPEMNQ